ncbi:lipoprotein signal peptidase [Flammeovirga pectinis]|uniref:Lipoprotein signal peptidase n=1 Tax=Flammeovirga pectinis TaxID=2494373 RepID=A0A3Q9FSI2_9BACT|nr:lipoprotein signal peptidase [Flammeovirga pectinis]AZQ63676.1 lipoprotein signal peptidase [Flammeovirga pectinis]
MGNTKKLSLTTIYSVAIFVIAIDQLSKLLVHNFMEMGTLGEVHVIGDWFRLHYLLNPGMAFGMQFGNEYGKLLLTLFRILASGGIVYAIYSLYKKDTTHLGFLVCISMILGGAIGNAVDSIFYGVLIEGNVIPGSSTPWFHGQVIDMLYFPMVEGNFPSWIPALGGDHFLFFSPVFNIADSAIFLGVAFILIFQNRFTENEN